MVNTYLALTSGPLLPRLWMSARQRVCRPETSTAHLLTTGGRTNTASFRERPGEGRGDDDDNDDDDDDDDDDDV